MLCLYIPWILSMQVPIPVAPLGNAHRRSSHPWWPTRACGFTRHRTHPLGWEPLPIVMANWQSNNYESKLLLQFFVLAFISGKNNTATSQYWEREHANLKNIVGTGKNVWGMKQLKWQLFSPELDIWPTKRHNSFPDLHSSQANRS